MTLQTTILTKKNFALHQRKQKIPYAIAVDRTGVEEGLDFYAIGETHWSSSGVNGE
jgi:hypothetical protein